MLEPIEGLPDGVWGLRAVGAVSHDDYRSVVIPHLELAKQEGRRVRLLFHLGQGLERFTPAGALSDARVGVNYMGLFERCAIVTDGIGSATSLRARPPALLRDTDRANATSYSHRN